MSAQFIEPPDSYFWDDGAGDDDIPDHDPFDDADELYEREAESWD